MTAFFESWFRASKYCQTIQLKKHHEQTAKDGWIAAMSPEHNPEFAELKCKAAAHDDLIAAAEAVLAFRVGGLPNRGWLADNDLSRKALSDLALVVAKTLAPNPGREMLEAMGITVVDVTESGGNKA
jgi:hypothetical protein